MNRSPSPENAVWPSSGGPTFLQRVTAEAVGTFLLVFFGCGAVHTAVLLDAQSGLWQVAVVWGLAIMLAIYAVGAISGAHINPAMTLALAVWGRHPWRLALPYVGGQLVGAMAAATVLYAAFSGFLAAKEQKKQVVRGEPGSVITAMCYGEYSPNPGSLASGTEPYDAKAHEALRQRFTQPMAMCVEILGTLILALVVFAVTDDRNSGRPPAGLAAVFIGLTVSALISVIAPLTQACFNPARDFGPRLVAYFAGWGSVAIPGLSDLSWLTVYILAPCVGAVLGGGIYEFVLRPAHKAAG